jgi:hypothetical protein
MDVIRWTQIKAILGEIINTDTKLISLSPLQHLNLQNIFTEFIKHVSREYLVDNAIDISSDLDNLREEHNSAQLDTIANKLAQLTNKSLSMAEFRKTIPNLSL